MATPTHNHTNYQARLDFTQDLLHSRLHLEEDAEVLPIQYDPESPFKYNNFVYHISLAAPMTSDQTAANGPRQLQPGCVAIPPGTQQFILRLTNPNAEGMNQRTRVENEVAIIALASKALSGFNPRVVPSVYAWGSAAASSSQGWILQELMPGTSLDEIFETMDLQEKQGVLAQKASLLKALQDYQLPENLTFGGVTFNENAQIVSTTMTSVGVGPWPSYEASFTGRLEVALKKADENPYIKGWHANGIRTRLDAFVERGVPAQFESLTSKQDKTIIHADFTANNVLYDESTKRITGLIDYDFACILHPSYEFLRSFDGAGGQLRGWTGDEDSEELALREAKLQGFPSPLPLSTKGGVQWEVAKAWEVTLEEFDVRRPRVMSGIDKVADVDAVLRGILPWRLSNSDILRLQSEEVILKYRDESEKKLLKMLERLGF